MSQATTYRESGVDIDEGNRLVGLIKPLVRRTFRPEVATDLGGFGALFKLDLSRYRKPLLVSTTDGVGTKLKIAFLAGKHDTVGIDLVAMSVNDLVVQGAEPLFFLDYFATGKLSADEAARVIGGIADGCKEAGCALIGGETAEMPGFYAKGEYDLAGFAVGIVEADKLVDGKRVEAGDVVFGLASSGLHSNGYSLARHVLFDKAGLRIDSQLPELGMTVGEALLVPTRIYVKGLLELVATGAIKALAHITGGGFYDNIPRVLPPHTRVVIERAHVPTPPIFRSIAERGHVTMEEMFRTFNMGIGMVGVCSPGDFDSLCARAAAQGETLHLLGHIEASERESHVVVV